MGRAPMSIVLGGTYSGLNITSNESAALIHVATTEPVTIEDSYLEGRSALITCVSNADLTIRRVRGVVKPSLQAGVVAGRFASFNSPKNLVIEGCVLDGTAGIYLLGFSGDGSPGQRLSIRANRVRNVRGNKADGEGGYTSERGLRQFFQVDKCNIPGGEIAWNEVINAPGESTSEDVINIYQSGGVAGSPLWIHHNFIQGAYAETPALTSFYSGGGILCADGGALARGHVLAEDNVVLDTTNYGIATAGGHDITIRRNRTLSAGILPDGTPIAAQNVGIYAWDADGAGLMSNIEVSDNLSWWVNRGALYPTGRNDYYLPNADVKVGNEAWPEEPTLATYESEHAAWLVAAAAATIALPDMG